MGRKGKPKSQGAGASIKEAAKAAQAERKALEADRAAAEARMQAAAWHPSDFEKGRWGCCKREAPMDSGCYTTDEGTGDIIDFPLRMLNGKYQ